MYSRISDRKPRDYTNRRLSSITCISKYEFCSTMVREEVKYVLLKPMNMASTFPIKIVAERLCLTHDLYFVTGLVYFTDVNETPKLSHLF